MNYLTVRDQLFSELHVAALKSHGYKKKGHWVTRDLGPLVHSFYLRASRFGSQEQAVFWIDVQVFSESWHRLVFPERPYRGPSEGPCLVSRELGTWCNPPLTTLKISAETNVREMLASLSNAVDHCALPFLAGIESQEALLTQLKNTQNVDTDLSIVGLSRLLGHEAQAREYMRLAKQNAKHENDLRILELRERNIWNNAV